MSAVLPWAVGAVVLVLAGVLATVRGGRHRRPADVSVDHARSLLSRLDLALDQIGDDIPPASVAEARRLQLLAGGCLAGTPGPDDARRCVEYGERALRLITR